MIVDTSALIAILRQEPEAERLARAMANDPVRLISAANWLEAGLVIFVRVGKEGTRDLDLLIAKYHLEAAPVTAKQAAIARRAFMQYGKGIHPASLNFGDCFSYALAKDTGEPLLFKGSDFGRTDVGVVAY